MVAIGYVVVAVVGLLVSIYIAVLLLSHSPREATRSELVYFTNDGDEKTYDLPPAVNSETTEYKDEGVTISVVVPCYNETERLGKMLIEAVEHLKVKFPNSYEILIVDDGSKDGSDKFALKMADVLNLKPHTLRVVKLSRNRGKGGAVTHGILHARGKYRLFADADGATKFSDMEKLLAFLSSVGSDKAGVAIGSRAHMVDTDAVVKRSFVRNFLMYCLHALVFVFGIRDIQDTQCGFKMFNFESVKSIFPHMHTERWIFDVEVLMLGELQGIKMKEIPVSWQEVSGSKIDIARDSIGMAIDLVVTRLAYLLGVYKLDECGRKNRHKKTQ
ncbi:Piso0_005143 [Millerozyma farinosa CBS 7064]|uniref:dolichyl-phosphate beta-glucosyltransferase n=1 Tax=Pichia sorbitophila (strain ATCC MYA-4447 / BCRC 22081 / CBS 7064 / NBRC 10061 / NRRL Y-12695) TaxID=559304 RepID=G8Y1D7_PICSO|nr:Piso0_005143 [Millerozyma farinosa CBS 7064]